VLLPAHLPLKDPQVAWSRLPSPCNNSQRPVSRWSDHEECQSQTDQNQTKKKSHQIVILTGTGEPVVDVPSEGRRGVRVQVEYVPVRVHPEERRIEPRVPASKRPRKINQPKRRA
jgi:hypothetical protein